MSFNMMISWSPRAYRRSEDPPWPFFVAGIRFGMRDVERTHNYTPHNTHTWNVKKKRGIAIFDKTLILKILPVINVYLLGRKPA